jgi:hypothetical protein
VGGWGLQIDTLIASSQPQDGQTGCEAARHPATTKGGRWLIPQICSLSSIRRISGTVAPSLAGAVDAVDAVDGGDGGDGSLRRARTHSSSVIYSSASI